MRTTIDIDEKLLNEAMNVTNASTKRELIRISLQEVIRKAHVERLRKRLGKYTFDLTLDELEQIRNDERS